MQATLTKTETHLDRPLRVAVWIDSFLIARWEAALVERLRQCRFAELALVVLSAPRAAMPAAAVRNALWGGPADSPRSLGVRCLELVHRRLIEGDARLPDPLALTDLREQVAEVPLITLTDGPTDAHHEAASSNGAVSAADLDRLRDIPCDVVIRLGQGTPVGKLLHWPRFGFWTIDPGAWSNTCQGQIGYWESMEDWPETRATLWMTSEQFPEGLALSRASSSTNPWSIRDNRAAILWKATALIPRQLERLHRQDAAAYFSRVQRQSQLSSAPSRSVRQPLSAGLYAGQLVRKLRRKLRHKLVEWSTFNQWALFYELSDMISTSFGHFQPLVPPRDRIWADPHVLYRDGRYYVFVEEFPFRTRRGHISVLTIDDQGRASTTTPVLQTDCHLSYPFVFEADGAVFMVPETASRRTIELYRCTRFPDQWRLEMRLMENVHAVDATLHHHEGRWWLFTNMVQPPGTSSWDELYLFWAEDFRTQHWQPHPWNPIVTDVSSARPAGKLFTLDGRLCRPSQNCSGHYGRGFNLSHVRTLTPLDYEEVIISRILPRWRSDLLASHSFSRVERLTIIDAQLRRWGRPRG
jgi:hypothetical protein